MFSSRSQFTPTQTVNKIIYNITNQIKHVKDNLQRQFSLFTLYSHGYHSKKKCQNVDSLRYSIQGCTFSFTKNEKLKAERIRLYDLILTLTYVNIY